LNEDGVITASLFCMQLHQFSIHRLTDGLQQILKELRYTWFTIRWNT